MHKTLEFLLKTECFVFSFRFETKKSIWNGFKKIWQVVSGHQLVVYTNSLVQAVFNTR